MRAGCNFALMLSPLAALPLDLTARVNAFLNMFGTELAEVRVHGVRVAIILLLAVGGWQLIRLIARRIVAHSDDHDDTRMTMTEKRAHTVSQLLRSVGGVILGALTIIMVLNEFINVAPLLGASAILGLAISFGAQSLVKDWISGFFILTENQFAVGDVIDVGGKSGAVERMTLRVVMLRDLDGTLHIVPNGQIAVVSNRTRGWSRAVVDVGVAYDTDVDRALEILRDEARRFGDDTTWIGRLDGAPDVMGIQSLGDNAIVIRVLLRTQPGSQWEAGREFRLRVKRRLDAEGIEIPFPQRTVHVRHHGPGTIDDAVAAAGGA